VSTYWVAVPIWGGMITVCSTPACCLPLSLHPERMRVHSSRGRSASGLGYRPLRRLKSGIHPLDTISTGKNCGSCFHVPLKTSDVSWGDQRPRIRGLRHLKRKIAMGEKLHQCSKNGNKNTCKDKDEDKDTVRIQIRIEMEMAVRIEKMIRMRVGMKRIIRIGVRMIRMRVGMDKIIRIRVRMRRLQNRWEKKEGGRRGRAGLSTQRRKNALRVARSLSQRQRA
jgi:hypothetical protein